jgi:hypothetical protein
MAKRFEVDVDITMSCRIEVDAESEEQAKTIVANWIGDDPWHYVKDGHYMSHEFEAVNEGEPEEDGFPELTEALDYVREQLGASIVAVVKAQVDVCYEQRRPLETDYDDEVHDLLEEWGEEHGHLSEEWWSESVEFSDIIAKI